MYRFFKICLFFATLDLVLSACGEASTQTAPPAASLNNTPLPTAKNTDSNLTSTLTPSLSTAPSTSPQSTPTCFFAADFGAIPSLGEQIRQVKDIVLVQVTGISPSVWNTTDGKAPDTICGTDYDQFSP